MVEKVRGYGMRVVGPNCIKSLSTQDGVRLNASFAECLPPAAAWRWRPERRPQPGHPELAARRRIGLSTFVSLGNKADVSGNDLLLYGESDPSTSVILLYLESFGNPRRFAHLARRISGKKPIIVVKAGRTPAGNRAAASHTAGLAASEVAVDGLFRQAGVIRLTRSTRCSTWPPCSIPSPSLRSRRVAILTNAGGPGIRRPTPAAPRV
jgi:acyl-CoA synthetase (NDP forming)